MHTVLTGMRGVGKTVLLRHVVHQLRRKGWLCGYVEVRRDVDVGVALATVVVEGSHLLPAGTRFRRALGKLSASICSATLSGRPDGTVSLSVEKGTDSGKDPYSECVRLFRDLAAGAREAGVGVALCVDEIQDFGRADATTLLQSLEADQDEDSRVLLLGAGLPHTPGVLARARTYAERFRYEPLDDLARSEAIRAVTEPADELGVRWEPDAVERLVEVAKGYPYFLQLYASEAWAAASGRPAIRVADLERAEERVLRLLDNGLYAARYQRASAGERAYLEAMASLMEPEGRVGSGAVAAALGKSLGDLAPVRDRLIRKGVIHSPATGVLVFSVPGFADYVRRRRD
jgi:hypothetical protein